MTVNDIPTERLVIPVQLGQSEMSPSFPAAHGGQSELPPSISSSQGQTSHPGQLGQSEMTPSFPAAHGGQSELQSGRSIYVAPRYLVVTGCQSELQSIYFTTQFASGSVRAVNLVCKIAKGFTSIIIVKQG
ncbi:hypothetical protein M8C21_030550 [Ambrosia artemisiifolia]|uniref:Uncharacterized protein n=1 Tax=Ambrosia artemisiifolia TaxID=4212 RepID=A0AAD5GE55_AMBAR|nr:hypothetical protein M8C21_030550 [Ambrosia artemisiifolia]